MFDFNNPTENDMTSLDDLLAGTDNASRDYAAFVGSNTGHAVLAINLPAMEAVDTTTVYNDPENEDETAQRELNETHANGLAAYVLHAAAVAGVTERERRKQSVPQEFRNLVEMMGPQSVFALAPWTANLRGVTQKDLAYEAVSKINGVNVIKVTLQAHV